VKARTRDLLGAATALISADTPTTAGVSFGDKVANATDSTARYWQVLFDEEDAMLGIRLEGDLGRRSQAFTAILVSVLLSFVLTAFVIRSITIPIAAASAIAEQLARGDLPEKVEVGDARDETADLLRAINAMLQFLDLRRTMVTLRDAGTLLQSAVANLQAQSLEQAQAVTRQAAALQETQVTSQEIKQTSRLAAEKAASVLQTAERAESVSRSGEDAITKTLSGLTDIRRQVDDIAQKIGELNQRAAQIGTITQTVKDLADQSNMLALNAAIEAVRSGEHGKGFGVVAREIRSLADQSIQSTNRVNEILESVAESLRGAVSIAETGRQRMETGIVEVRSSGESLRELSGIVRESSQGVRQIAAAVSQQDAGISQIFIAVSDQSKLMDETARRLDDTTAAVMMVEDVARRVTDVVGRFNV
jgi:methyl-accepting chemotaxis protein